MATKKKTTINYNNPPQTLAQHMFYGMRLDEEQAAFRDAIWSRKHDIIFCSGRAGTGKSTIAILTAMLMYNYGLIDGIHYIINPTQESVLGYLPGDNSQKIAPYMSALWSAIETADYVPEKVIRGCNIESEKAGEAFITAESSTFLRGSNIGANSKKIVIIDEAQNFTVQDLRKTLTRVCDGSIVIVVGQEIQCDLKDKKSSGFIP